MATTPEEHYKVRQETLGQKARDGIIHTDDCRRITRYVHLSDADADEINRTMTKLRNGLDFKKDKRAKSTVRVLQSH